MTVKESIFLNPVSATNSVNTQHTLTAKVQDNNNGNPVVGRHVTFSVISGPNADKTGFGTTNSSGIATFTYTGLYVGTDTIEASFVDSTGATRKSNQVTKEWEAVAVQEDILLTPVSATNPVNTNHTLEATVQDVYGNPVTGRDVTFSVISGPNADKTGFGTTNSSGITTFTYTDRDCGIGIDTIEASFVDSTGATRKSTQVTKEWTDEMIFYYHLDLTPLQSVNLVGQNHTVTATLTDTRDGSRVQGKVVYFGISSGPNSVFHEFPGPTGVTDSNGKATFTYTGALDDGTDTIESFVFVVKCDNFAEFSNEVRKTWVKWILLTPASATNPVNTQHTLTVKVQDDKGKPLAGVVVTFTVVSGPNAGMTGNATTNASGEATFTYTSKTVGTDTIEASFVDSNSATRKSNQVTKTWEATTVVNLVSFTAKSGGELKVEVEWETATETDNAGFDIYRARGKNGKFKKINPAIIPAQGDATSGAQYSFEDTVSHPGVYFYKLKDIDTSNKSTSHGPVKVKVKSK